MLFITGLCPIFLKLFWSRNFSTTIFVSAGEELSKTGLSLLSYDSIFAKISSSEIEELIEKNIVQDFGQCQEDREMKNLGYMTCFIRTMLSNLKPGITKIQNQLI